MNLGESVDRAAPATIFACRAPGSGGDRELRMHRLVAETRVANVASCRLLERLGMTRVRTLQRFGVEQTLYVIEPEGEHGSSGSV